MASSTKASLHAKPKPTAAAMTTHRAVLSAHQEQSQKCADWVAALQDAVNEGIDVGVPDSVLGAAVGRILELEQEAAEEAAVAKVAAEARTAVAATPIKTPVTRSGSRAALRAAAAARVPLGEGSVVQLKGLAGVCGLYWNYFDVNLEQYNGRKGRVSREPPPWVIKAVGATAGEHGTSSNRAAELGGLVPVLLDCRSSDDGRARHRGVWLAVPPDNLKVL